MSPTSAPPSIESLFPDPAGVATPAAPVAPVAPAVPAAPMAPAQPAIAAPQFTLTPTPTVDPLAEFFGSIGGAAPAAPGAPAAPAQPAAVPGGPAAPGTPRLFGGQPSDAPAPAAGGDLAAFMARIFPDNPDWVKGDKALSSWKDQKAFTEGVLNESRASAARVTALEAQLAEYTKAGATGAVLPETEAVRRLTEQLTGLQDDAHRWREHKSRLDIESNPAFRSEFDTRRAQLADEAREIAREAGMKEEDVAELFSQDTALKIEKWIDARTDLDPAAARLLKEQAREFGKLSKGRAEALKAPDPFKALDEWRQREDAFRGQLGAKMAENIQRGFLAALPDLERELSENPYFRTPAGRRDAQLLEQRITSGAAFAPKEVVRAMAMEKAAVGWRAAAASAFQQIVSLRQQLATFGAMVPSLPPGGGGQPGGQPSMDIFGSLANPTDQPQWTLQGGTGVPYRPGA